MERADYNYDLVSHRVKLTERAIEVLKKDDRDIGKRLDLVEKEQINIRNNQTNIKDSLEEIKAELKEIKTNQQKDQGWRVVLIDFIKAAAQIAALIGAGKFIF